MKKIFLFLFLAIPAFGDVYHYGGGVDCTGGTNGQFYITNGSACSFTSFVDALSGFIASPTDATYTLDEYAKFAYTINDITLKTSAGTATVAIQIAGVSVTGLSAISVSSVQSTSTASAANSVAVGNRVTLVESASSSPANLAFTLKYTR